MDIEKPDLFNAIWTLNIDSHRSLKFEIWLPMIFLTEKRNVQRDYIEFYTFNDIEYRRNSNFALGLNLIDRIREKRRKKCIFFTQKSEIRTNLIFQRSNFKNINCTVFSDFNSFQTHEFTNKFHFYPKKVRFNHGIHVLPKCLKFTFQIGTKQLF